MLESTGVTPGYFDVMGIAILEGRTFDDRDVAGGPADLVLSKAAADRFWPEGGAVGKVVYLYGDREQEAVVVGVAGNAKIWSLTEAPRPYLYRPIAQSGGFGRSTSWRAERCRHGGSPRWCATPPRRRIRRW